MHVKTIVRGASTFLSSILIAGTLSGAVAFAAPATVNVGKKNCVNTGGGSVIKPWCTVQEGVDAAASGDTVNVAKGTYTEQVTIGSGKSNLTLRGAGKNTVIQAPATMTSPKAILRISTATGVTVQDLTISGPGGGGCDSLEYGVRIDTAGQATLNDLHITNIADNPFSGCQNGVGVQVGRSADSTTGSATIINSKVEGYQKNGITVSNTGSSATVAFNTITGAGPTAVIAQNGIQVSSGATANIHDNIVKGNVYTPQTVTSTGILLLSSGTVTVTNNVVNNNDTNIYVGGVTNSTFTNNVAKNGTFNGFYVDPASTGNTFTNNAAKGTTVGVGNYDIQDDSTGSGTLGTANTWHNNGCKTSKPALLCQQ